jgi:glycosyltransferase involved in cell wall biosynthesis
VARVPPAPGELYNVSYLRNEGVAHSRGAYLCFIDGDILLPHPHYLAQMAALHAGRDDYALAMPRRHRILRGDYDLAALVAYIRQTADWLDALEPAEDFAYRCRWDTQPAPALIFRDEPQRRRVFADASQLAAQGEGGVLWQANVFGGGLWVSRAVFDLVGGYSEQFSGWGSQDLDLAERISRVCEVDMLYTSPAHDTLTVYHFEHPQDTRLQQAARNRALRQQRATQPLRALLAADMRAGFSSYVRDLARRHPWLEIA